MVSGVLSSILLGTVISLCSPPKSNDLVRVNQFVSRPKDGESSTRRPSHILSAASELKGFDLFYELEGLFLLSPTLDCGSECTIMVRAIRYENQTFESILMVREDESRKFDFQSVSSIAPLFCVPVEGVCGAFVPLFEFQSDELNDHYANTDLESGEPTYSVRANGRPLCFVWSVAAEATLSSNNISIQASPFPLTGVSDSIEENWPAWKITVVVVAVVLGVLLAIATIVIISTCCSHQKCWSKREPATVNPYPRIFSVPQTPPRPVEASRRSPPTPKSNDEQLFRD